MPVDTLMEAFCASSSSTRVQGCWSPANVALSPVQLLPPGMLCSGVADGYMEATMKYVNVEEAVAAVARGQLVLVVDESDRGIEGDLIAAAGRITAEQIEFMTRHADGLICLAMKGERLDELRIPPMAEGMSDSFDSAFTVSIDLANASGPGHLSGERARTIRAAVDPNALASQFSRPGHVFPLRYAPGGVLMRRGRTEAAVDLARMAGYTPAAVLCELIVDAGTAMSSESLSGFAEEFDIPTVAIDDLIAYLWRTEELVERGADASLPTPIAGFRAIGYRSRLNGSEHFALVLGDVAGEDDILTRLHSACLTGDVFASLRCDCGDQLKESMSRIAEAGRGVIVYNPTHEGRGTGLVDKLAAYHLQDQGVDTADANTQIGHPVDGRHYGIDAQILRDLGIGSVRLLTNNPQKIDQLRLFGVAVSERVPLWVDENPHNRRYLATKETRLGHLGDRM